MRAKRLTYSQVEFLCEQLAMILGSGMSVSEGLGLLCADSDDRVLVSACNEISSEVDRGEPLSQAMRSTGRFPEYAVDMVALGEMSGKLEDILEKYVGNPVELIPCGGGDRIAAEREQWNDGSNTLCIAPGTIVVYERNDVTNALLKEKGLKVLEMPSAELSRGRGGPRCMSMPLVRED